MELVRARCDRNEWVDLIEPRLPTWLGLVEALPVFDCATREADDARRSCDSVSRIPSSHFRLRVELAEIFRERFLDSIAARSSATPFAAK